MFNEISKHLHRSGMGQALQRMSLPPCQGNDGDFDQVPGTFAVLHLTPAIKPEPQNGKYWTKVLVDTLVYVVAPGIRRFIPSFARAATTGYDFNTTAAVGRFPLIDASTLPRRSL